MGLECCPAPRGLGTSAVTSITALFLSFGKVRVRAAEVKMLHIKVDHSLVWPAAAATPSFLTSSSSGSGTGRSPTIRRGGNARV